MGKTSKNLWPANTALPDIDISYYKSLPNVPYIEGAKDDVKAYIIGLDYKDLYTLYTLNSNRIIDFVSEDFDSEEDATHFALALQKHNYAIVQVLGCRVYAKAHLYSVLSNYKEDENCFIFANWA